MKKKYYFVYKTIFEDGHYYIGQHKTDNLDDNYIGSGTKLKKFLKENPTLSYKRQILCYCNSIGELNEQEIKYVGDLFLIDDLCLNLKEGGWGHTFSEEAKHNIGEGVKKAYKNDPTIMKRVGEKNKGRIPWNKGLKTPDDVRKKLSISHIGIQAGENTQCMVSI